MTKRFLAILLLFALSSFSMLVIASVDDQGNPNDPSVNNRANACYEGGSMEGKCDTEWEWTCGYYLIRMESSNAELPLGCASLIQADAEVSGPMCINTGFAPIRITGAINTSPNVNFYDPTCTSILVEGTMVQAPDQATADTLCTNLLTPRSLTSTGSNLAGGSLPSDYWFCSYAVP